MATGRSFSYDSVAFRYIAANSHPDHDRIASFRKRFLEEISRRKDRISAITRARKEIEHRAAQRYEKEKEAYEQKRSERKARAELTGKKPRGRNPEPPEPGPRIYRFFLYRKNLFTK